MKTYNPLRSDCRYGKLGLVLLTAPRDPLWFVLEIEYLFFLSCPPQNKQHLKILFSNKN